MLRPCQRERVGHRDEDRGRLLGRLGKTGIVLGQVGLAQEPVGGLDGGDPGQRQLLGQAILQGPEGALAAASGLRRAALQRDHRSRPWEPAAGRDVADAKLLQRPAGLGQLGL